LRKELPGDFRQKWPYCGPFHGSLQDFFLANLGIFAVIAGKGGRDWFGKSDCTTITNRFLDQLLGESGLRQNWARFVGIHEEHIVTVA
jgi:hypothetical protein